ncbi:hypothetical protein KBI52_29080 [Microvirga sp. HBU67558]|uniref:hypothetical protein n=1 Tax=Microvirga TaxID=186650 RepID=UPI001B37F96F|nr:MULTISPECIES: hypothetical protein [unclassified Microvirga]MBQ0824256.1 hypothetical protein [Microvirga sp. HBU67558]
MSSVAEPFPGISQDKLAAVAAVWSAPDARLSTLIKAGGLDPKKDFRGGDFRGWQLAGQDLRGIDFTGADLRGTGVEYAITDGTTVLTEAQTGPLYEADVDSKLVDDHIRVGRMLAEAYGISKDNPKRALSYVTEARSIVADFLDRDYLNWAYLAAATEICYLKLFGDTLGGRDLSASILTSVFDRLEYFSEDSPEAISIMARDIIPEMDAPFRRDFYTLYVRALDAGIEAVRKTAQDTQHFKHLQHLVRMRAQDRISKGLLDAALADAKWLKEIARKASLSAWDRLRYTLWAETIIAVILAEQGNGSAVEQLRSVIDEAIRSDDGQRAASVAELIRVTAELLRIANRTHRVSEYDDWLRSLLSIAVSQAMRDSPSDSQKVAAALRRLHNSTLEYRSRATEIALQNEYAIRRDLARRAPTPKHYSRLVSALEAWSKLEGQHPTVSLELAHATDETMSSLLAVVEVESAEKFFRIVDRTLEVFTKVFIRLDDQSRVESTKRKVEKVLVPLLHVSDNDPPAS